MIVTVCRTLNEERNIERFCTEYSKISDRILICDGGSRDKTLKIASSFDKVDIVKFKERVYRYINGKDGPRIWRNPHGKHLNYMFAWAIAAEAEWIIYDDCDSLPNKSMKEVLPSIFDSDYDSIKVLRYYLYKDKGYFYPMSHAGFARWAWRTELGVWASEADPWHHHMTFDIAKNPKILMEPNVLLHYSFPDDEEIKRKAAFYATAKRYDGWDPLKFGGELFPLPEWAVL